MSGIPTPLRLFLASAWTVLSLMALAVVTSAQNDEPRRLSSAVEHRAEGLILARCTICHSADLLTQQRLPRARWKATIEKMRHWGAELSDEEADLLLWHLSKRYDSDAPDHGPALDGEPGKTEPLAQEPVADVPIAGAAGRGASLYAHNCQVCHGSEAMGGVGPRLAKNSVLTHEDLFWDTVLHGRGPMPAWSTVLSRQDIADIQAWLATK